MPSTTTTTTNNGVPASPTARRSSNVAFSGLMDLKRTPINAEAAARRASFHDTKPKAGFFGQMWTSWTHGPQPGAK